MAPQYTQSQKFAQSQTIAPQMRQSLKILQSSSLELLQTISEELLTNPVLEELPKESEVSIDDSKDNSENNDNELNILNEMEEDSREFYKIEKTIDRYGDDAQERHQFLMDSAFTSPTLAEHLMKQATILDLSKKDLDALEFLIGSLDDNGFLSQATNDLVKETNFTLEELRKAQSLLMSFDPIGVGADNLRQSLLFQLEQEGLKNSVEYNIICHHFELLSRKRIVELAKEMHLSMNLITDALHKISSLNPAPGRSFQISSNTSVSPDITISRENNHFSVSLNNEFIPKLRISQAYKNLLVSSSITGKDKEYIKDKIKNGKFVISAIEQRQQTLKKIAELILELQKDFFKHGVSALHPLTMAQMAEMMDLHETTISRAIANKFALTPHGLYPLKFFFTSGYETEDGSSISNTSIKDEIAKIISQENPDKPLSDQKIADILAQNNMQIARRTVAKYREELGILPTSLRKKY